MCLFCVFVFVFVAERSHLLLFTHPTPFSKDEHPSEILAYFFRPPPFFFHSRPLCVDLTNGWALTFSSIIEIDKGGRKAFHGSRLGYQALTFLPVL